MASPQRPSAAWGFSCTNPGSMWDRVWKDWKLLTGTCQQDTGADIQAAAISKFTFAGTNFACRTTVTHIYYTCLLQRKKKRQLSLFENVMWPRNSFWFQSYVTFWLHLWAELLDHFVLTILESLFLQPQPQPSQPVLLYSQWQWLPTQHPPTSFDWPNQSFFFPPIDKTRFL